MFLKSNTLRKVFQMKRKLIFVLWVLLFFGFVLVNCSAQSSTNDQRIVGTWVYTHSEGNTITLVFNTNGSGTTKNTYTAAQKEGATATQIAEAEAVKSFTYGFSVAGEMMSDNGPSGKIYFSPDGRTLFIDGRDPYRKR